MSFHYKRLESHSIVFKVMINQGQSTLHHRQTLKRIVAALPTGTNAYAHLLYGGSQNILSNRDTHGQRTLQTTLVMPNHPTLLPC
jgi:hypothetical protein